TQARPFGATHGLTGALRGAGYYLVAGEPHVTTTTQAPGGSGGAAGVGIGVVAAVAVGVSALTLRSRRRQQQAAAATKARAAAQAKARARGKTPPRSRPKAQPQQKKAQGTRTRTVAARAPSQPVIVVRGLQKSYGEREAVRGIDLTVGAGEIFAFLGPNGAGKTTTVEILEGYRARDGGEVSVLGLDPSHATRRWRERVGVVLQELRLPSLLTVREVMCLYAGYYPSPRPVDETIELVGLADAAGVRTSKLSGGQQRRCDVALALIGDPELLFLDEPTTGFDPAARRGAWRLIRDLQALGKTVFLTTHYLDEAQNLADRVAILKDGMIVAEGRPGDLVPKMVTIVRFRLPSGVTRGRLPAALAAKVTGDPDRDRLAFETEEPVRDLATLTSWALGEHIELLDLEATRPTLEDVYLKLVGSEVVA
ncbi:MAG: ABC transporter ATP-binding protein, partial [Acidimicrobiales bacterium]